MPSPSSLIILIAVVAVALGVGGGTVILTTTDGHTVAGWVCIATAVFAMFVAMWIIYQRRVDTSVNKSRTARMTDGKNEQGDIDAINLQLPRMLNDTDEFAALKDGTIYYY